MNLGAVFAFDLSSLDAKQKAFIAAGRNMGLPLRQWGVDEGREINQDWGRINVGDLYAAPRLYRGTTVWDKMPPQYVRKTADLYGVPAEVPPYGGVPRIGRGVKQIASDIQSGRKIWGRHQNVTGNVKAKLRPSGRRVSPTSIVMADTNEVRRQFTTNFILNAAGTAISLVTNIAYAVYLNARRPFAVLTIASGVRLRQRCQAHWDGLVRKWNRS